MNDWLVSLLAARVSPHEVGRKSALLMRHGTMSLRYYAPKEVDPQTPHDQDELYFVQSGTGYFFSGRDESRLEKRAFGPGDAIFVPANHVHRFVDFTPDFGTWVVFWGPTGGEKS